MNHFMLNKEVTIIPEPVKLEIETGYFILKEDTVIQVDPILERVGQYLKNLISPSAGYKNQITELVPEKYKQNAIILAIKKDLEGLGREGYVLKVCPNYVLISALNPTGIFYGIQSFRQLLPVDIENEFLIEKSIEWIAPCVKIEDFPRFPWRGFMLDEGRHFLGKEVVKRMIDLMALHKLNIFHWHLTEDQGWRVEIKKYPRLTEIGSKRKETQIGGYSSKKTDTKPHNGYYTQEDIKEVVSYAGERFIKIIPEINIPGHSMAALAAYPKLSCIGGPFEVQTTFGIKKDVFCPGKDEVFNFLQDILDEIMEIFPSKIIHTGGDEVPKERWKNCPNCQVRMKTEGIASENSLQIYFTNRIASYLSAKGRIMIGWNDILDDILVKEAISQHWLRRDKTVLRHLRRGRKFVISKFFHTYLDYDYHLTPLKKTYCFEPIPKDLEEEFHENILGIEAPLWTEWISDVKRLDWQTFPRLTAIAEIGWTSKKNKNYKSFERRLHYFFKRLDRLGVQYAQMKEVNPNIFKRLSRTSTLMRLLNSLNISIFAQD